MSTVFIESQHLEDIATAIRSKNGEETTYKPREMATAISLIATAADYILPVAANDVLGGIKSGGDINVDENGIVSVNDNSHNHTIENITNLQEELDNINSAIDNIDVSGQINTVITPLINDVNAIKNDYLTSADETLLQNQINTLNETSTSTTTRVSTLETQIGGLSGAMHFKGVKDSLPLMVDEYSDGDVIVVGNKEYVFNGGNFIEFGDVTEISSRLSTAEKDISDIKTTYIKTTDIIDIAEENNTNPISSNAVYTINSDIENELSTIKNENSELQNQITTIEETYLTIDPTDTEEGTPPTNDADTLNGYTAEEMMAQIENAVNSNLELSTFGITASASEINALDGITITSTELNNLSNSSGNLQEQIDNLEDNYLTITLTDTTEGTPNTINADTLNGKTAEQILSEIDVETATSHANAKGVQKETGFYKIASNSEGHIISATPVVRNDIINLGFPFVDCAAAHNGIFRGKNIQDKYENGTLWTAIQSGTFEDLYIGDYFDITISTSFTASETVRCVLAGFDCQYNRGDTALTTHHAVIVPYNSFTASAQMNSSNVTTGGYVGSAMYTSVLPVYQTALENVFGSHLLTSRELLTTSVNTSAASGAGAGWTGSSNNWGQYDCKLRLMSEVEVYGATVFSSSGYDTGNANQRLPYFTLNPGRLVCGLGGTSDTSRAAWWLSSVSSSTSFARVSYDGGANGGDASYSHGVRPRFLVA